MAGKILWTGVALILGASILKFIPAVETVGQVILIIGAIVNWFERP